MYVGRVPGGKRAGARVWWSDGALPVQLEWRPIGMGFVRFAPLRQVERLRLQRCSKRYGVPCRRSLRCRRGEFAGEQLHPRDADRLVCQ